jgi:hypothetical protein
MLPTVGYDQIPLEQSGQLALKFRRLSRDADNFRAQQPETGRVHLLLSRRSAAAIALGAMLLAAMIVIL